MMTILLQILASLFGSLGFGIMFHLHGKKLYCAALGGCLCWVVYLCVNYFFGNDYLSAFITSAVVLTYSEIMARVLKSPATVFNIIGIIPIIPGAALYQAMNALVLNQWDIFAVKGQYTLMFAICMAAGIALTTTVFTLMNRPEKSV